MSRTLARFTCRLLGLLLTVAVIGNVAWGIGPEDAPELDPTTASSAIALLIGAALLAHDKFRQR